MSACSSSRPDGRRHRPLRQGRRRSPHEPLPLPLTLPVSRSVVVSKWWTAGAWRSMGGAFSCERAMPLGGGKWLRCESLPPPVTGSVGRRRCRHSLRPEGEGRSDQVMPVPGISPELIPASVFLVYLFQRADQPGKFRHLHLLDVIGEIPIGKKTDAPDHQGHDQAERQQERREYFMGKLESHLFLHAKLPCCG